MTACLFLLQVVIRIADYLQVESERAPTERLKVLDIKSPISQGEWRAHQAIKNITFEGPDPEALEIRATPKEVQTFLRLQALLTGLQNELDLSWAVLGEVYGRHGNLCRLALELRRVRSNIDDVRKFSTLVTYVPVRARFASVDAQLLSLLAEPLYGNESRLGIRELIQNAMDACRELVDFCAHTNAGLPKAAADVPHVVVNLKGDISDGFILEVTDRGIGMTENVVLNYFLKAGASYRSSDAWRKMHEAEPGKSRVLRSGRFGIGILAAFILGDQIEVTTRHFSAQSDNGIRFRAEIDDESIELQRCNAPFGTRISIKLKPEVAKELSELQSGVSSYREFAHLPRGLYVLDYPKLELRFPELIQQQIKWPNENEELPLHWHRIKDEDYSDIQWSYKAYPEGHAKLAVNGLAVGEMYDIDIASWDEEAGVRCDLPSVSVFDPNGKLPLVLTRNKLATRQLPFQTKLIHDVCRDIVAFCLVDDAPLIWRERVESSTRNKLPICRHPGLRRNGLPTSYLLTRNGFSLNVESVLRMLGVTHLVLVTENRFGLSLPQPKIALSRFPALGKSGLLFCDSLVRSSLVPKDSPGWRAEGASMLTGEAEISVSKKVSERWPNKTVTRTMLGKLIPKSAGSDRCVLATKKFDNSQFLFEPPRDELWALSECLLKERQRSRRKNFDYR